MYNMNTMRKIIIITLLCFLTSCNGQSKKPNKIDHQKSKINHTNDMRTFNIKSFEENKGKQEYDNEYRYKLNDGSDVRELDITSAATKNIKTYKREITKEFKPFQHDYTYYENGNLKEEISRFNDSGIEIKEYDKNGKFVKETNLDKNFKHTFEQIHDIILKEKKVDIYDTRQAIALRHDTPFGSTGIKKYYQIHVLKSELVQGQWYSQPNYSLIIDDETGKFFDK